MKNVPQKPQTQTPVETNILIEQGAVHTYEKDMEQALRGEEGALVKETIQRAREDQHARGSMAHEKRKNRILIWLSILFIAIASGGIYYSWKIKQDYAIPATPTTLPVVSFDSTTESIKLPTTPERLAEEILKAKQFEDEAGTLRRIQLTNNENQPASSLEIFQNLGWHIDEFLTHSLTGRSEIGIYTEKDGTKSVFILGTTDGTDSAYRGLAAWELKALEDTAELFNIQTTTINDSLYQKSFEPITIKNKDGRALYDDKNNPLIIVEFLDNNHFIVTNSKDTVKEVLVRLAKETSRNIVR
ncbi:MAG: hypothetical protein ACR2IQ_01750 [Minisyncoccia bacterium]